MDNILGMLGFSMKADKIAHDIFDSDLITAPQTVLYSSLLMLSLAFSPSLGKLQSG